MDHNIAVPLKVCTAMAPEVVGCLCSGGDLGLGNMKDHQCENHKAMC